MEQYVKGILCTKYNNQSIIFHSVQDIEELIISHLVDYNFQNSMLAIFVLENKF